MASTAIPTAVHQPGSAQYSRLEQVIGVLFVGYLIIGIPLPVLPLWMLRRSINSNER